MAGHIAIGVDNLAEEIGIDRTKSAAVGTSEVMELPTPRVRSRQLNRWERKVKC